MSKNIINTAQVQSTNDASIVSKCSLAKKNYVKDNFVKFFVEKEETRAPLIHLGYYPRFVLFSRILVQFMKFIHLRKFSKFQIISCGSGFDTTYWRLAEDNLLEKNSLFVEIDYPNVISRKISFIKKSDVLKSFINVQEAEKDEQIKKLNDNYFLLCVDLSDLKTLETLLQKIKIDFNAPTLFLSECVITYMKEEHSNKLLQWICQKFQNSSFVNYEQIHPKDGFGEVMMRHFNKLQATLHSVLTYPTSLSHIKRYRSLGFNKAVALSEWDALTLLTPEEERNRAFRIEPFDEFEEFHLKCVHYVFAVAANGTLSNWPEKAFQDRILFLENFIQINRNRFRWKNKGNGAKIFGHSICQIGKDTLIFGGFSPQGRSNRIYKFDKFEQEQLNQFIVQASDDVRYDAIHGSAVSLSFHETQYVGLYGGRTSPGVICNGGDFILLEYTMGKLMTVLRIASSTVLTPRYRHSMVSQSHSASEASLWIFGGRTADLKESLPELWQLKISRSKSGFFSHEWVFKKPENLWPTARMSHGAAICPETDAMYITCGLDTTNYHILKDVWKFSFATETWHRLYPKNLFTPRYGHSSHIRKNILYLVGGVSTVPGFQPSVAIFYLDSLNLVECCMEPFAAEPVLLFNHKSVIVEDGDDSEMIIFGGGGNCFSFGTYFNPSLLSTNVGFNKVLCR